MILPLGIPDIAVLQAMPPALEARWIMPCGCVSGLARLDRSPRESPADAVLFPPEQTLQYRLRFVMANSPGGLLRRLCYTARSPGPSGSDYACRL
jgi:hypothetical protein